jgi:hypothetical protein
MQDGAITEALKFSISWINDFKTQKYYIGLFLISFIAIFISYSMLADMFSSLGSTLTLNGTIDDSILLVYSIIGLIVALSSLGILLSFFELAIIYMVNARAFETKKYTPIKIDFRNYFMLLILGIVQIFAAIFSIMNLKLLIVGIVSIVLLVFGAILTIFNPIIGIFLIGISSIGFLGYLIIIYYNTIKLSFSAYAFIEKKRTIMESLQESWNRTEGQFWKVFVAFLVFGIIIVIAVYLAGIPSQIYLETQIANNTNGLEQTEMINVISKTFTDPINFLLSLITIAVSALATIATSFYMVSIYDSLPKKILKIDSESEVVKEVISKEKKVVPKKKIVSKVKKSVKKAKKS